jgi:polysaccharide biosynthesis/export protein
MKISAYFSKLILLAVSTILIVSCVPQHKIEYFQFRNLKNNEFAAIKNPENRKISIGDELHIQAYSYSGAVSGSVGNETNANSITPYGAALLSYKVNDQGEIIYPLVGNVNLVNLTITEAELKLKTLLISYLNSPSVVIKLVNTNISVLGDVKVPGNYVYSNSPFNIFQAISLAGDINEYGDRKNIRLMRNVNGNIEIVNLDLTKNEILQSKYFYIEPNDVIYVRPLKRRRWGINQVPFELVLSAISTTILVVSYVKK